MKRSRREIIADILTYCFNQKAKGLKTHIMCHCELNYTQINQFIPALIQKKFLEQIDTDNPWHPRFLTTDLGKQWLNAFHRLIQIEGGEKKHDQDK